MDSWMAAHTYLAHAYIWYVATLTVIVLCVIGASAVILWCAAVAIGSYVEARQERATRRRNHYRVGSVIRP
jgi:hypothetical protein